MTQARIVGSSRARPLPASVLAVLLGPAALARAGDQAFFYLDTPVDVTPGTWMASKDRDVAA